MMNCHDNCQPQSLFVRVTSSHFLFSFVIDILLEITLFSFNILRIDVLLQSSLVKLEYTEHIVVFGENAGNIQSLLSCITSLLWMRYSPSKCYVTSGLGFTSSPRLVIWGWAVVEHIDHSTYLESLISVSESVFDEFSARIQKARFCRFGPLVV